MFEEFDEVSGERGGRGSRVTEWWGCAAIVCGGVSCWSFVESHFFF